MATREIVKVQNQQPSIAPTSNLFSAIIFKPSDSTVQASMAVSESPPSDVSNGSGKKSDAKNKSSAVTEAPSEEHNEDNSKTSGIEGKTEDGDAIEKAVDEARGEGKTGNDDDENKDEAESGAKDGSSDNKGPSSFIHPQQSPTQPTMSRDAHFVAPPTFASEKNPIRASNKWSKRVHVEIAGNDKEDFLQCVRDFSGAVLCAAGDDQGHVHGDCHSCPFKVVLVGTREKQDLTVAWVYSSETGMWGDQVSTTQPCAGLVYHLPGMVNRLPCTLVGNVLYWLLHGSDNGILEFDLDSQRLALIERPSSAGINRGNSRIIRLEDGSVGLAVFLYPTFNMWKRKVSSQGVASWARHKIIDIHKIIGLPRRIKTGKGAIVGYSEDANAVFISVSGYLQYYAFIVQLESMQSRKLNQIFFENSYHLFADFYTAGSKIFSLFILSYHFCEGGISMPRKYCYRSRSFRYLPSLTLPMNPCRRPSQQHPHPSLERPLLRHPLALVLATVLNGDTEPTIWHHWGAMPR
uniref:Uncharacterized protein n=1 Tax=Aegilops tauschii TaxID=37682 RepID=M8AXZ1_AEGTA